MSRVLLAIIVAMITSSVHAVVVDLSQLPADATVATQEHVLSVDGAELVLRVQPVLNDENDFVAWYSEDGGLGLDSATGAWGKWIDANRDSSPEGVQMAFFQDGNPVSVTLGSGGLSLSIYDGEYDIFGGLQNQTATTVLAGETVTGALVLFADDDGSAGSRDAFRIRNLDIASLQSGPSDENLLALQAQATAHESVQLVWQPAEGVIDRYEIYRDDSLIDVIDSDQTSYHDGGLSPDTSYRYEVRAVREDRQPNILVILADDMGWGDVQCNYPAGLIPTPNIDALAAEGLRCTDAHSPSAVCSPTRYGLLTGRYPWREPRLRTGVIYAGERLVLESTRPTLPGMLQDQGYATVCFGKWHLGLDWQRSDGAIDYTKPFTAGPLDCGFDSYFGCDVPNFPPYGWIQDDRVISTLSRHWEAANYARPSGPMADDWTWEGILPRVADETVAWLESRSGETQPFFCYLALTSPHFPVAPSEAFQGSTEVAAYGDFVHETDHVVGRVLQALEDAGKRDNTLVIFSSDNGSPGHDGADYRGQDRTVLTRYGHAANGPFRGWKSGIYEGGHRVPFIARWPHVIAAGRSSDETISLVDCYATIAGITGHRLQPGEAPDSYDLSPLLLDAAYTPPLREATVSASTEGMQCLRMGDWKFIDGAGCGGNYHGPEDQAQPEDPPGQLYDMASDPGEQVNLYEQRPDLVAELETVLEGYNTQTSTR